MRRYATWLAGDDADAEEGTDICWRGEQSIHDAPPGLVSERF